MTEILSLKHVSKVYDNRVQALYDVSFDVRQGELISIIGPSGAGKSTLLRCINRMIEASEGQILFLDQDVTAADKKQLKEVRKNIGMIFQNYNLVYRLSVLENVMHGRLVLKIWFLCTFSYHPRDVGFLTGGSVLHCSIGSCHSVSRFSSPQTQS